MRTGLVHSGHFAGDGMEHDDYGYESFPDFPHDPSRGKPITLPNDKKYNELCGPVRVIHPGRKAIDKNNEKARINNGD